MGIETAIAIGASVYQGIKAAQAESEAQQAAATAANRMAQIEQQNAFKDLQIPTLGLELAQQNIQQKQAQDIRALQEMGPAGVLGGLTGTQQQAQAQNLQLAALANEAQYNRDVAVRQQQQAINAEKTARLAGLEQQRLQGAQAAATRASQEQQAAIAGGASAVLNQAFMNQYFNQNVQPDSFVAPDPRYADVTKLQSTAIKQMPVNNINLPTIGQFQTNPIKPMFLNQADYLPKINPFSIPSGLTSNFSQTYNG